jgi:hypothetical protein
VNNFGFYKCKYDFEGVKINEKKKIIKNGVEAPVDKLMTFENS